LRAPVRNRVLDVRIVLELGDRLAHRLAILNGELLGAARERLLRDGAGALLSVRRDARRGPVLVAHDHLAGDVVARDGGCRERERAEGECDEEEPGGHWSTVRFAVYGATNNGRRRKL
jgi:hypothetical protein